MLQGNSEGDMSNQDSCNLISTQIHVMRQLGAYRVQFGSRDLGSIQGPASDHAGYNTVVGTNDTPKMLV